MKDRNLLGAATVVQLLVLALGAFAPGLVHASETGAKLSVEAGAGGAGISAQADASAKAQGPTKTVQAAADELLGRLQENRQVYDSDATALRDMVREVVFPKFDFQLTSRWVLGEHWKSASAEQRQRFVDEFSTLLLRTYSTALRQYDSQRIEYAPARVNSAGKQAIVRTRVFGEGAPMTVDYRLSLRDGDWLIADARVGNISLVETYRSEYASIINRSGMDGLLDRLVELNRKALERG